jgi:cytochrome c
MSALARLTTLAAFAALSACGAPSAEKTAEAAKPLTIEERGKREFRACAVCHAVTDPAAPGAVKLVGPSLWKIYGAKNAHQADFDYSKAMREANLTWDDATLDSYITNPQNIVPRTRMAFAGEPDAEKRAAIIAYLKTLQ